MPERYDRFHRSRGYDTARHDPRWSMVPPLPFGGWYPGALWSAAPFVGWGDLGWYQGPYPVAGARGYDSGYAPRRRPEESPTYGRDGDRALRRWARRYGYDVEHSIQPRRRGGRSPLRRGRYDTPYRGR